MVVLKKTDCNAKITEIEGKIPSVSDLAINTGLTTVENKIANISSLVKKTGITQKLLKLKRNLLIIIMISIFKTPEFSTLAADVFKARLAQANLVTKQILMQNCLVLIEKLPQIKQNTC